jgi:hypothetical protein
MKLLRSTRNPYISINTDTKELWFTGRLSTNKLVYPFSIGDKVITSNEQGVQDYFPHIANSPTTSEVKAMGRALLQRLKKSLT